MGNREYSLFYYFSVEKIYNYGTFIAILNNNWGKKSIIETISFNCLSIFLFYSKLQKSWKSKHTHQVNL